MRLWCAWAIVAAGLSIPGMVEAGRPGHASPFDGRWRIDYSCKRATGLYAQRCAAGDRDYLELNLAVRDGKLCGTGGATAQLGNRDGGASVIGVVRDRRARVDWEVLGAHGHGYLDLRGATLIFRAGHATPDDDPGWSFPPASTTVLRRMGPARPAETNCSRVLPNP